MTDSATKTVTPLLKPRLPYLVVDNNETLQIMIAALQANTSRIGIDAERASGFRYGQRAYLIQIAIQNQEIFLLDPTAEFEAHSFEQMKSLISETEWVIHAASQDIPCLTEIGITPIKLVDTELAGRLLNYPKVSLGVLCEELLSLSLAKEHSAVDWSQRPLPKDWLNYAALDVDVLFDLWNALEAQLRDKSKFEIALAEFAFAAKPINKDTKPERWRGTTGIHEIKDQKQLTAVKHLWESREELAQVKDVAPGRLVPDSSLIALVKAAPTSRAELAELRAFSGRASRTYLDRWWDAYQSGLNSKNLVELRKTNTGIPNHRSWPGKFPDAHRRFLWAKKNLQALSESFGLPVENLLSPGILKEVCFSPNSDLRTQLSNLGARNWQIDAVFESLEEAFQQTELPEVEETSSAEVVENQA